MTVRSKDNRLSLHDGIRVLVPAVLGWRTFPRAVVNLLLFGLTVVAGEWIVHQTEYLIEYGNRFGSVMASTPHRHYMSPLGSILLLLSMSLLLAACVVLSLARVELQRLLRVLPYRLAHHVPGRLPVVPLRQICNTWLVLSLCQICLYVLQENLEAIAQGNAAPGMTVLFGARHGTVVPLHLGVGLLSAVILWVITSCVHRALRAVQVAKVLAAMVARRHRPPPFTRPPRGRLPNLGRLAGSRNLRAPPLLA